MCKWHWGMRKVGGVIIWNIFSKAAAQLERITYFDIGWQDTQLDPHFPISQLVVETCVSKAA